MRLRHQEGRSSEFPCLVMPLSNDLLCLLYLLYADIIETLSILKIIVTKVEVKISNEEYLF